tara:strand:+ start:52 stop:609 length:558 start_codon:yes stop_codon:yes gene_type:complete
MPRANKINNLLKVEYPTAQSGTIKYDNPRQNIDPAIVTQDVTAKNILFDANTHIKYNGISLKTTATTAYIDANTTVEGRFAVTDGKTIKDIKTWTAGAGNASASGADYFKMPAGSGRGYDVGFIYDPTEGQMITLIGTDITVTIDPTIVGSNIILPSGLAYSLTTNKTLTLLYSGTKWFEVGRSH